MMQWIVDSAASNLSLLLRYSLGKRVIFGVEKGNGEIYSACGKLCYFCTGFAWFSCAIEKEGKILTRTIIAPSHNDKESDKSEAGEHILCTFMQYKFESKWWAQESRTRR